MVIQDPDAGVLTQRYAQEIRLQRSFFLVLLRRSWHRHLAQESLIHRPCASTPILLQWSCTSGPRGPWYRHPDTSCARDPHTVILHKWSYYRILAQRSWKRDLGQEIRRQRSCASGITGSWRRDPDINTLHKRSSYTDLSQAPLQDPRRSWHRHLAQEILIQWSCTSSQRLLMQKSRQRHLAEVVLQDSDAEILTRTWHPRFPTRKHRNTVWGLLPGEWIAYWKNGKTFLFVVCWKGSLRAIAEVHQAQKQNVSVRKEDLQRLSEEVAQWLGRRRMVSA